MRVFGRVRYTLLNCLGAMHVIRKITDTEVRPTISFFFS